MKHLGDIQNIQGNEIDPVDCITFGSPCQDLSVAGKRQGLAGERSGLFAEAIRVIREMRETTNGKYPKFAVWENVPGAFSSNKGEDFRTVLENLSNLCQPGIPTPRPGKGRWTKSGCVFGDRWSIAWRTMDAQYWGVPQRRRRIALVVDFGGQRAGEILFERESLPRNFAKSGKAREISPKCVGEGIDGCNPEAMKMSVCAAFLPDQGAKARSIGYENELSPTLRTEMVPGVLLSGVYPDVVGTLCASGAGLSRPSGQANETDLCIVQNTILYNEESITSPQNRSNPQMDGVSHTLNSTGCHRTILCVQNEELYVASTNGFMRVEKNKSPTLLSNDYKAPPFIDNNNIIRRLTPLECERLQGFPDNWTAIDSFTDQFGKEHKTSGWLDDNGKWHKATDSPRYRALGNSIALPQWRWLFAKMGKYLPKRPTLGSLFDGIGGFPLAWEEQFGKHTALWASEIEPFAIAVTKYHFPEEDTND